MAKRGAAEQTPQSELDELLDAALGEETDEDRAELDAFEEDDEDDIDDTPNIENETEDDEADEDDDAEDAESAEDETSDDDDSTNNDADEDDSDEGDEEDDDEAGMSDRERALLEDLKKERKRRKAAERGAPSGGDPAPSITLPPPPAAPGTTGIPGAPGAPPLPGLPVPPAPAASTAPEPTPNKPTEPPKLEVDVDENGNFVLKNPQALFDYAAEQAKPAQPEENRAQRIAAEFNSMASQFVMSDPATAVERTRAVTEATQADQYLTQRTIQLMQMGYRPNNAMEGLALLKQAGVEAELEEHFPAVAANLDEFMMAMASDDVNWKATLLGRLASHEYEADEDDTETIKPQRRPIRTVKGKKLPKSMTKKGGARQKRVSSDESEFNALEKEFESKGIFMDPGRYDRLEKLGVQLEKEGWFDG